MFKIIKQYFLRKKIKRLNEILEYKKKSKKEFMKLDNTGRMAKELDYSFNLSSYQTREGGLRQCYIRVELQDGSTYTEYASWFRDALKEMYKVLYKLEVDKLKKEIKELESTLDLDKNNMSYCKVEELSKEEQIKLYMTLTKKELCEMLYAYNLTLNKRDKEDNIKKVISLSDHLYKK